MINEEGKKRVRELRKEWVITDDEMVIVGEQQLLRKLYECQDEMEKLLDKGKRDEHYHMMQLLIKRLEKHLANNHDLM